MINTDMCKKIVYAIEQAASARWFISVGNNRMPENITFPLDAAIEYLEAALRAAAAYVE